MYGILARVDTFSLSFSFVLNRVTPRCSSPPWDELS